MPGRSLVVLVILAALYGAPSPVSAAGNELSAPNASPSSGSTATLFTFSVHYDGKFPAIAVTASVAGRPLNMGLVAGTPTAGTWSVATTLPPGTWAVTFAAAVERGNPSSIAGPSVTVSAPSTPPPPLPAPPAPTPKLTPAPPPPTRTTQNSSPPTAGPAGSSPVPTAATPEESQAVTREPADESPSPDPRGGVSSSPDAAIGGGPAADEQGSSLQAAAPGAKRTSDTQKPNDGLTASVLFVGIAGVAAVALIGTAVLIAGRRRDGEEQEPTQPGADDSAIVSERRNARRATVRLSDDPIVAAMGLGTNEELRRPRHRAGQVGRGPGERPHRRRSP